LKASLAESAPIDELLRDPEELGAMLTRKRKPKTDIPASGAQPPFPPFRNEPPLDFARVGNCAAMRQAIESVRAQLGRSYPLIIGGDEIETEGRRLDSVDPSHSSRVVGQVALADVKQAESAVVAARKAFPDWSRTPAQKRASVLIEAARLMRNRRFELAAWEVFECGKPWAEADGDIAEAIDFCEFYAREMCRLAEPRHRDAAGEVNFTEPISRGVAVVIPPWNFPLAIPTGMTVAALVTGNTVVLKPAEQSPVIAWQLARILGEAGLPPDRVHRFARRGPLDRPPGRHGASGSAPYQAGDRRNGGQERDYRGRRCRPGRGCSGRDPERLRLRRAEMLCLLKSHRARRKL
jgi:delta 1-pyrroline-5-carboxylate dehydrogenase